ncbi:MAG: hypothetical protein KatS3mg118_3014 [Paracoccaceae bacterium]|nr:MAG: hypothetical protein KatS3mg118_3014 [Paracoccaceae bacterium]
MQRPLPERKGKRDPFAPGANPGLLWNKFFDGWDKNEDPKQGRSGNRSDAGRKDGSGEAFSEPAGGPAKQAWIGSFARPVGEGDALEAAGARVQRLVRALGGRCEDHITTAPFVTGTGLEHPVENGFVWHHTLGVPYLPASMVKGLVRAWAEHWLKHDAAAISRIFGGAADAEGVGSVIVFDALPTKPATLMAEVLTPHDGGWRQGNAPAPSDWHSPVPIPFLVVAPGAQFRFAVAPRPGAGTGREDVALFMDWLKEALDWIGAGAKTAVGFGRFLQKDAFDEQQKEMKARQKEEEQQRTEAENNRPLRVGDEVVDTETHETGVIIEIAGDEARVEFDDGIEDTVPVTKLKRR